MRDKIVSQNRPRSSKSQNVDSVGKHLFGLAMSQLGWRATPREGDDFGLDGSVAIFFPNASGHEYSALDFTYQLKSSENVEIGKDGLIACSGIKKSTVQLFRESNSHPIIVAVDTTTKKIYWDFATVAVNRLGPIKPDRKTVSLKIDPNEFDPAGCAKLAEFLKKISASTPRPIQAFDKAQIILAKLDPHAEAEDIKSDLQDTVDIANAGHYERAVEKALPLLDRARIPADRVRIFKVLIKSYYELQNLEDAIKFAEAGLSLNDDSLFANFVLICTRSGDLARAWKYVREKEKTATSRAEFLSSKGYLHLMSGEPKEALDCLARAIELNPKLEDARMNEAFILRDSGNLIVAKEKLLAIFTLNPLSTYSKVAFANILLMEMQKEQNTAALKEAEQIYDDVINQYRIAPPKDLIDHEAVAMARIGKSVIENNRGNLKSARQILREVDAQKLKWRTVYYDLAQCELGLGNTAEARRYFVKALRIKKRPGHLDSDGSVPDMWEGLAKCFFDLYEENRTQKLRQKTYWAYRVALKLNPAGMVFVNLGVSYVVTGRLDAAFALADKHSSRIGSHYLRAMCYMKLGQRDKLLPELLEEAKLDPSGLEINFQLGNYWFEAPDWNQALLYYETGWKEFNSHLHLAAPNLVAQLLICYKGKYGIGKALEFFESLPDFLKANKVVAAALNRILNHAVVRDTPVRLFLPVSARMKQNN